MKGGVIICAIIICELINGFTAAPFVFPGPSSDDYSDFGVPEGRELFGHRKHNFPRGHGCRGHGCLGIGSRPRPRPRPDHGGYYPNNNQAGTFATASAGSSGAGNTQANAQSASFNFGPFSASFSSAQASSGNQPQFSSFLK